VNFLLRSRQIVLHALAVDQQQANLRLRHDVVWK
jgi:hypothetical protein